jgi:hypothetical protein
MEMSKRVYRLIALLLFCFGSLSLAQEFKSYKGAKPDAAATAEAQRLAAAEPELEVTVYVTADPFEKVHEFYRGVGTEFRMAGKRTRKMPNGQELRDAFIILDGAKNILTSKMWVKLQRPYIGAGLDRKGTPSTEIRDVTAIVLSKRK